MFLLTSPRRRSLWIVILFALLVALGQGMARRYAERHDIAAQTLTERREIPPVPAAPRACCANTVSMSATTAVAAPAAGSVLVFPYYISTTNGIKDTKISISNTGSARTIVHLFFVTNCSQADLFISLAPNACHTFSTAAADPGQTGYLVAVVVDADGKPIQRNNLIGHAILKDGNYEGVYEAEVFRANSAAPATNNGNFTATLHFDGTRYDLMPNQLSVNIQSPVNVAGQKVVTAGLLGNVNGLGGAAQGGTGQITNSSGIAGTFSGWLLGQCQAMATISASNPVVSGGLSNLLPSGQTGTMRFGIGGGVGVLLTPRTTAMSGHIQPLAKTGYASTALTVPVYTPTFFTELSSLRQPTVAPEQQSPSPGDSARVSAPVAEAVSDQTFAVKGGTPAFLPIMGVKAGDTVYIEATLHDARPGKNQQNRPLIIESSRSFSARVNNYALPTAFTYKMEADCEIFKAYIQNASSTESAVIKVRLKKKERLSQNSKSILSTLAKKVIGRDITIPVNIKPQNVPCQYSLAQYLLSPRDTLATCLNSPGRSTVNIRGNVEDRPTGTYIGNWTIARPDAGSVGTTIVERGKTDRRSCVSSGIKKGDAVNVRKSSPPSGPIFESISHVPLPRAVVCNTSLSHQIRGSSTVAANKINNLSLDPPDANFTVIDHPLLPEALRMEATEPLPSDPGQRLQVETLVNRYNAFLENQLWIIAYAQAMYTAMNRADGALEAGDTFWEDKQVQAMERYQFQLAYLLNLDVTLRRDLHQALIAAGFTPSPVTADEILQAQTELATNDFPDSFIETLQALGAESEMIEMIRAQFIVQEQEASMGFPDNLIQPDLLEAIKTAASELLPTQFRKANGSILTSDLGVTVNTSSLSTKPGENLTYTVTVENFGPETATNVILTTELPSDVDFVSVPQGQCNKHGNFLTCEIPTMNAGARSEFQVVVRATEEGIGLTTFYAVALQPDAYPFNNAAESPIFAFNANTPAGQDVCLTFGKVTVCFANVTAEGQTTVTPMQAMAGNLPSGYLLDGLNIAFDITTTATYSGSIIVTFNDLPVTTREAFSRWRVLHGEQGQLVDRTILAPDSPAPSFATREISARVTSLSPFVLAAVPAVSIISNPSVTGSVLVFPLYTSAVNNFAAVNTRLNFTNTDATRLAYVHVFFVSNRDCTVADSVFCLTPNQTASFLASDFDPDTTGYVIAVAVDARGCPINFNHLMGSEFVKLASGHTANLQAQTITALPTGVFTCNATDTTTTLKFDGVQYSLLPHTLAVNNLASPLEGNDTLLILDRIGGDLYNGAAARLSTLAGLVYNDREIGYSFVQSAGQCQLIQRLNNGFPRTSPPLGQIIPVGRTGWLRFNQSDNGAMIGAVINLNPKGFNQGHYLHVLRYTSATLTIPVYAPSCVQ